MTVGECIMIKSIVFDMGGVLIDFNFDRTLNEVFDIKYHDIINEKVFRNPIWSRMDAGLERSDDVISRVVPELPLEIQGVMKEMISDFYPYMPPIDGMADLISRLKNAGYSVYLLSNASPRFFDRYMDYPALVMLDGYFISALYKLLKPQPEIYDAFCNKFSVKAEECFFIDDMPQNIEGAKAYGMQGFVFKKDISSLECALRDAGVNF